MHYLTAALYTRSVEAIIRAAERAASRRLGWVPCDFPHETLATGYEGGAFAACPHCGAAV